MKFGSHDFVIQVDEIMLKYKCKTHRGRSNNKIDASYIVECIWMCYRRQKTTIILIIKRLLWQDQKYEQMNMVRIQA